MNVTRLLHTVRYLKPVQVYGRLWRPKPRVRKGATIDLRARTGPWSPPIPKANPQTGPNRFQFLNQERDIRSWNDAGVPKLWLYHLHYFDCPNLELIEGWSRDNPWGQGNGWEPYPLSLRICNWIKWALEGNFLPETALQSLSQQAEYLAQSMEFHLLANHLFVNAKALVFAGRFFSGPAADRWLRAGLKVLEGQIPEQILHDGGHFERSPMYHALVLEDILDLVNLIRTYPDAIASDAERMWIEAGGRMAGWLTQICHPDGEISFFNDAAIGIAPTLAEVTAYAQRLGVQPSPGRFAESGYVRLENESAVVIFDAGPVGPDYQPGHAHADTLSFELSIRGRRAVVNSGTSTYENNSQRLYQRGTSAHNTARVDGIDQSEVWSAFRVARRARPVDVQTDNCNFAEAGHTGYLRLKDPVLHRRRLELRSGALSVTDIFEARQSHELELFFHLHPDADVALMLDARLSRWVEETAWFPEFNRSILNKTIIGRWGGRLPVRFTTLITW